MVNNEGGGGVACLHQHEQCCVCYASMGVHGCALCLPWGHHWAYLEGTDVRPSLGMPRGSECASPARLASLVRKLGVPRQACLPCTDMRFLLGVLPSLSVPNMGIWASLASLAFVAWLVVMGIPHGGLELYLFNIVIMMLRQTMMSISRQFL